MMKNPTLDTKSDKTIQNIEILLILTKKLPESLVDAMTNSLWCKNRYFIKYKNIVHRTIFLNTTYK